ncbi:hypothetical protein [Flavihumibacter sp. CACIAM 22H1]|uniref:hypothetical protein n=1 Tax=Flavihumibacter sp. CACIAM 22H1 TaxID=1812911 RepID=UPI0007A808C0|nr:hypothetical protein [Flavihumibacter sp. CACIAM 22H1]KYP12970.1 MAG: hypothetical protein A1D16_10930 [Flavihumibacter sp. CACIAM 22H1]
MIKSIVQKYGLVLLGVLVGGIAGFIYYSTIGCSSGTCAITSKPVNSTVYFAIMGGLLASLVRPKQNG